MGRKSTTGGMVIQPGGSTAIRTVMLINQKSQPELFEHLEDIPPALRPDRLRFLASLGLMAVAGGGGSLVPRKPRKQAAVQPAPPPVEQASMPAAEDKVNSRRARGAMAAKSNVRLED